MDADYFAEERFDHIDFTQELFPKGEYEGCKFVSCNLANADLTEVVFLKCEFVTCNLSLVKLVHTAFRDVKFTECKILGMHFENCSDFGLAVWFDNCILDQSSFYKTKLIKTSFINSKLIAVDFTQCDLTGSVFDRCDLLRAKFEKTNLEKVDFLTSFNYSIDPELNRVRKAKFSNLGLAGLLDKYDIDIK
jgi:fluoroquinolone resistance protein